MRSASLLVALLLGACSFEHGSLMGGTTTSDGGDGNDTGSDVPTASPWLPGFLFRKTITISPPTLTAALTDFPVGILEAADAQLADSARSDGLDIVFTSSDALFRLDHELVKLDGATGAIEAWVRIPTLPNGQTTIYMYYGAAAQPPSAASAVWPAQFAGVWHMGGTGGTTSDSTSHAHDATSQNGGSTPAVVAGIAGSARSFDGSDAMSTVDPADGSLDFGTNSFSFSLWVNVPASSSTSDVAMNKGGLSGADPGYAVFLGTGNWAMRTNDGTVSREALVGTDTHNQWICLVGVVDRGTGQQVGYRNGVAQTPISLGTYGSVSADPGLYIGGANTTQPYSGLIDELRVMSGVRGPDWIAAEHANLASSTFTVFGTQQMKP